MERIPAKERFSRNPRIDAVSPEALREAVRAFGLDPGRCRVEPLSGGFMNANFRVAVGEDRLLFRFYSSDRAIAEREAGLLRLLRPTAVRVPEVFATFDVGSHPVMVREHLEGETLEDRLLSGEPLDPAVYEDIGRQAALLHGVEFERAGFLGPGLVPGGEYESFSAFLQDFIESTLEQVGEERLAARERDRLLRLVRDRWPQVLETEPRRQLAHCDFNPKNILISSEDRVCGVLDWEFGLSGNGLIDLGNFFRFEYDYPPEALHRFARGYEEAGGSLPAGWRGIAALLDIGNMCSFLERREDYPETFRTARDRVGATLARFGC